MSNKSEKLNRAKENRNDEFYTFYKDIEKEVEKYKNKLKGKVIYCNCDNPSFSNFYKYLKDNFKRFELKLLISTYLNGEKTIYNGENEKKQLLKENGGFESEECVNILKQSDIVITNPPFSIINQFLDILINNNKDFLIIAPLTCISNAPIIQKIKEKKINIDTEYIKKFYTPENDIRDVKCIWFTSFRGKKTPLLIWKKTKYEEYDKLDNEDAINVKRIAEIPTDYTGKIAVPQTIMLYNYEKLFDIVDWHPTKKLKCNGKYVFQRIIIQKKKE